MNYICMVWVTVHDLCEGLCYWSEFIKEEV
jgi:hypothetical protein